jgi:hypothetical protein
MLSVIMRCHHAVSSCGVITQSVACSYCYAEHSYAEFCYAEYHHAECRGTVVKYVL